MLTRLTIKNFALIRDLDIELKPGFVAFTGETGAGKSLLVAAIAFLAGSKALPGVVRNGAQTAVVEGEFQNHNRKKTFIHRELHSDGRIRSFIDDHPVSNREVTAAAAQLLDITSQRAFSRLLDANQHLEFLDAFAKLNLQRQRLAQFAVDYTTLQRRMSKLERQIADQISRCELAVFQMREIDAAAPAEGEDRELLAEIQRLEHIEELHNDGAAAVGLLLTDDTSAAARLAEAEKILIRLTRHDPALQEITAEVSAARSALKEAARIIEERCLHIEFSPQRLEALRSRQAQIAGLARKYGGSLTAALELRDRLRAELTGSEALQAELVDLKAERSRLVTKWQNFAKEVSNLRRSAAVELERLVTSALTGLGVPEGRFIIDLRLVEDSDGLFASEGKRYLLDERGIDKVLFLFSANPGVEPKPVAEVASGGELSRLLLALKEALPAIGDDVTVLFDEIDTGISGRIAHLVGEKLRSLSSGRQLLAITHLPQIAALADQHWRVSKASFEHNTATYIEELEGDARLAEIAVLLSDGKVTKEALEQARLLSGKYKV
ncbi:MAG: DNA repair protein RecN [Calditrichaeota bacterium]|nr:DNA repair protein RecN [Calditrichota bacterium]